MEVKISFSENKLNEDSLYSLLCNIINKDIDKYKEEEENYDEKNSSVNESIN